MKIDRPVHTSPAGPATGTPAADAAQAKAAGAGAVAAPKAGAADASAQVELSSTAATLLAAGAGAEFDADKVKRMGDAIANGTFSVNAEAIADKLIANAQELLAKVKG